MKIIGFLGGQYGDAIITLGAQNVIRKLYPDCEFTFALSRKYSAILPLFKNQPQIQHLHTWEGYDDAWPTVGDREFLEREQFDIVFNPMQAHREEDWFLRRHQVSECCHMYGLPLPETNEVTLFPNFDILVDFDGWVGMSVFPNNNQGPKALHISRAVEIASFLKCKGKEVVQFGTSNEPRINNADIQFLASYYDTVRALAGCKLLITGDTGLCWVASALKIPVVGLFARAYYPSSQHSFNWQPVNNKAIYLDAYTVDDIPMEYILEAIEQKI